ncbi:MAG: hypothetical protein ACOYOK_08370 [Pseudobdellovibrionaceae bacterium]
MSKCPHCEQDILIPESSYGTLFTCENCNSIFFISWEGAPEKPSEVQFADPVREAETLASATDATLENATLSPAQDPVSTSDSIDLIAEYEKSIDAADSASMSGLANREVDHPTGSEQDRTYQETAYNFSADPSFDQLNNDLSNPNFIDVVEFGNSVNQQGPITYNIYIEGLDSAEVLNQFRDAIDDVKFSLQPEEVLSRIQNGKLVLEGLNPIKTSVIVARLQLLPLQVRFQQVIY